MASPRTEAILLGLTFYATGKACKYGHSAMRYTSSGECTVCEQSRRALAADRRRRQAADWYEKHKDRKNGLSAEWYETNRERALETRRSWRSINKDAVSALYARRKARKLQAAPEWDRELTNLVDAEAAKLAKARERLTGFAWAVDHMIPLQCKTACGLHVWSNLQVIPSLMNKKKFNRLQLTTPGEWVTLV